MSLDNTAIQLLEKRLAVSTNWGFFASFGMGFVLSGFNDADWVIGLIGYVLLLSGFVGHIIINRVFHMGFNSGEIALGLVLFGISALSFIGSWLFVPGFGSINLAIGLSGFASITACLFGYLLVTYGLRGTYELVHSLRGH